MIHYGLRAVTAVASACRENSAEPYRAQGRPARCGSIPAAGGEVTLSSPAGRQLTSSPPAGGALRPSPLQAAAPAPDGGLPRTDAAARRADALARSLSGARDRLAAPLARIAASLVRERAGCAFGFARATDFAREHFGRSGRWLRDLSALHQALSTFDDLTAALTRDDGGPPLGRRRALLIARVATAETLPAWLALARRLTVRESQAAVARARSTGEATPPDDGNPAPPEDGGPTSAEDGAATGAPEGASDTDAGDLEDCENRSLVRVAAPRAVVAAFDEAIDLYRAVEGSEATVTSFVEALVGEAAAGGSPPDAGRARDAEPTRDADRTQTSGGPAPAVI